MKAIAEEIEVRFADEPKVSDSEIAGRIVRILDWDPSVPKQGIAVKVEHGWVTLSGEVEWNFQKQEARAAAGRVGGVRGVLNLIAIRPRTTASDVRARIVDAFERSSALDAEAIDVEVKDGIVRLRGKVRGWNERRVAENAAWSAPGVTKVEDDIVLA